VQTLLGLRFLTPATMLHKLGQIKLCEEEKHLQQNSNLTKTILLATK
jgi:hypothetical protein